MPDAKSTSLNGINASGQLVGTYTDAAGTDHAFFKNNGSPPIPLDPGGTVRSQGGFINSQGQVVGEYRTDKARGFIWRNGTFTTLNLNFPNDLPTVAATADQLRRLRADAVAWISSRRRGRA